MTGASDDGGEHGPGGVVSGEPGLAHAGAVVHNQGSYIIVTHLGWWGLSSQKNLNEVNKDLHAVLSQKN